MAPSRFLIAAIMIAALYIAREASAERAARTEELQADIAVLRPLHAKLGPPRPDDWLAVHPEPGQTFQQYLQSHPVVPDESRRRIYIQPLGDFYESHRRIIETTTEFIGLYFGLPVQIKKDLPLSLIPPAARRRYPTPKTEQILTTYVLDDVLRPNLPADAFASIALTSADLWPGKGWNFVFGQASLRDRVGVWSIYRNGDPDQSPQAFRLCLLRTMKTAVHEVAHMFSMHHCTLYQCGMNGSNHRAESDRRPLALCPECMAKLVWATGADPVARYRNLAGFCTRNGLEVEGAFYEKSLNALAPTGRK